MARLSRLSVAGWPHQLLQRGNNGQAIVTDDQDREAFLAALRDAASSSGVAIHAYALLDTEVHIVATPVDAQGLSRMMQRLGRRYVGGFNQRHGRTGTLWDGRFRATVLEPARYLLACICFVELVPTRAGLVRQAQEYRGSSAAHHLGIRSDPIVTDHPAYWAIGNTPFEREAIHRKLLEDGLSAAEETQIANATQKGWALGSERFVLELEHETPRRLQPTRRGRPRKAVST